MEFYHARGSLIEFSVTLLPGGRIGWFGRVLPLNEPEREPQFVRIGRHAMIGGMSGVERDVIPYGQVMGDRARLSGLNIIGMQRRGFSREDIQALRSAYQFLFSANGTFNDRVNEIAERYSGIGPVDDMIAFIRADSTRAICQPKGPNGG